MADICTDNRFELIEKYKRNLIEATNIETSPDEMAVLDNILFRFWQMGWLDKLEQPEHRWIPCSERLPEKSGYYLVTCGDDDRSQEVDYCNCEKNRFDIYNVIAWMPMPEPYAERREDGN